MSFNGCAIECTIPRPTLRIPYRQYTELATWLRELPSLPLSTAASKLAAIISMAFSSNISDIAQAPVLYSFQCMCQASIPVAAVIPSAWNTSVPGLQSQQPNVIGSTQTIFFLRSSSIITINGCFSSSAGRCRQSKSATAQRVAATPSNDFTSAKSGLFTTIPIFCRINGRTAQRHNKIQRLFKAATPCCTLAIVGFAFTSLKVLKEYDSFKHFNYLVCDLNESSPYLSQRRPS